MSRCPVCGKVSGKSTTVAVRGTGLQAAQQLAQADSASHMSFKLTAFGFAAQDTDADAASAASQCDCKAFLIFNKEHRMLASVRLEK